MIGELNRQRRLPTAWVGREVGRHRRRRVRDGDRVTGAAGLPGAAVDRERRAEAAGIVVGVTRVLCRTRRAIAKVPAPRRDRRLIRNF